MSEIIKGSRVVYDFNKFGGRFQVGQATSDVVRDPLNNQLKVYVKWDNGAQYEVYISTLISEDDAKIKQTKFEEEFNALQKAVTAKMEEATKLLGEANTMTRGTRYSVSELIGDYNSFTSEISSAGWNTSSWNC